MFCNNCGNEIDEGGQFCVVCGKPLSAMYDQQPMQPQQYIKPQQYGQQPQQYSQQQYIKPQQFSQELYAQPQFIPQNMEQPVKKKKGGKIAILIAVAILLVTAGVVAFFIIKGDENKIGNSIFGETKATVVEIDGEKIDLEDEFFSVVSNLEDAGLLTVRIDSYAVFSGKDKSIRKTQSALETIEDMSDKDFSGVLFRKLDGGEKYLSYIYFDFDSQHTKSKNITLFNGLGSNSSKKDFLDRGFLEMVNFTNDNYQCVATFFVDGEVISLEPYKQLALQYLPNPLPANVEYLTDKGIDLDEEGVLYRYNSYIQAGSPAASYLTGDMGKIALGDTNYDEQRINEIAIYLACMDYGQQMVDKKISSYGVIAVKFNPSIAPDYKEIYISQAVESSYIDDITDTLQRNKISDDED